MRRDRRHGARHWREHGGFSILHAILIAPIPYRDPSRLVLFSADLPGFVVLIGREGAAAIAGGLVAGALGARLIARFLAALLFQVKATDAATYAGVAALLTLVAFIATMVPAVRAARADPMGALRAEETRPKPDG